MVGSSSMLLFVYVPRSGLDEEDCIVTLETVRTILTEGRKAGVIDFIIGGDINIEPRLGNAGEDLHCLTALNGMAFTDLSVRVVVRMSSLARNYDGCSC